ncbi:MAG: response regulator transcription factor [Defluviitaleaceae bacterium]|nr:response regulator transcription factor [Defluviitaleaceae bacterium]
MKIIIFHAELHEGNKIKNLLHNYDAIVCNNTKNFRYADMVFLCGDSFDAPLVVRSLRKKFFAPIIVFSKEKKEKKIVEALDAGAHDFFVLPFGSSEHFARIRAAFRNSPAHPGKNEIFFFEGLSIDFQKRIVISSEKEVRLTPIEFRILSLLAKNQGFVFSHEQIIDEIWGPFNSDNLVLRVNIANIRRKIEPNHTAPKYILTEKGVGYFFAFK